MKKLWIVISCIILASTAIAQKEFVVDANAEMRTIQGSFHSIKVSNAIDLYLSQSDQEAIAVSASEDKYKEGIKTVVEDNVLKIYYEGDKGWSKNRNMKVYISFRELKWLQASGASDIRVQGTINVPVLQLNMSGASDFNGAVSVTSLTMNLSGASDVKIAGKATNLTIESSGASDVKGYDLVADICTAKASGASDINVTVNKELSAHASGASSIHYKGDAVIKENQSNGASSIGKRGG
ncbi:MAG TPA: head GIN domain-containing protein [Ferruginibacter sp.]|nr:head GIN domain-containing protein [Ferruginibacter sp.]